MRRRLAIAVVLIAAVGGGVLALIGRDEHQAKAACLPGLGCDFRSTGVRVDLTEIRQVFPSAGLVTFGIGNGHVSSPRPPTGVSVQGQSYPTARVVKEWLLVWDRPHDKVIFRTHVSVRLPRSIAYARHCPHRMPGFGRNPQGCYSATVRFDADTLKLVPG